MHFLSMRVNGLKAYTSRLCFLKCGLLRCSLPQGRSVLLGDRRVDFSGVFRFYRLRLLEECAAICIEDG